MLITFLLCEQEILLRPVLYLSYFFKKHRQEYYDPLQAVQDRGTWESWLTFFLHGVVEVSKQATETARRILTLRESHRTTITEQFGRTAGNGHRVLEHLYQHPIVSVNKVEQVTGTTYRAANELINRFVDNQILEEITGQARNRQFMYRSYTNLFRDNADEDASP